MVLKITLFFVSLFIPCILSRSALKIQDPLLIYYQDNQKNPTLRLARDSDSQSETKSASDADREIYTLDFPKRFFPGYGTQASNKQGTNGSDNSGIVFPSQTTEESVGVIPYRFSRPTVNSDGKLTFVNSGFTQGMAETRREKTVPEDLQPDTGISLNQGLMLLAEKLTVEKIEQFTNWIEKNKLFPVEGTGAVVVENQDEKGLGIGNFALSAAGILRCPEGQTLRNGNCEIIVDLGD